MNATEEKQAEQTQETENTVETIVFRSDDKDTTFEVKASPQAVLFVMTKLLENMVDGTGIGPDLIMNQVMRDLKHRKMSEKMSQVSCDLKDLFSHLTNDGEDGEEENN